ncbi:MAG: hypothetical protein WC087_00280 [Candidatus Paceibacterota bacterium]
MMEETITATTNAEVEKPRRRWRRRSEEYGSILWVPFHLLRWVASVMWRNKVKSLVLLSVGLPTFWVFKPYFQPLVVNVRILLPEILGFVILVLVMRLLIKKGRYIPTLLICGIVIAGLVAVIATNSKPHYYHTLYAQFKTLDKVSLEALPETRFERIHPLNSIHTATNTRIADTLHTPVPDYVSWGDGDPHWTVGIEPAYPHQRFFGKVDRIFSLPGQSSLLEFGGENQIKVNFDSGETMYFTKDVSYLARQSFAFWRFLSYEPSAMKYIPGPDGKMVQCVTLTKWDGFIFPRPHFGGVVIIKQSEGGFLKFIKRLFVGEGDWIRPEHIKNYDWLAGQNLVPYEVSRHVANSFRFRYGYLAPFPLTHYRDIRIPDLAGDVNEQPFTTFFSFGEGDARSKLYHYFALEPYQDESRDKSGLSVSVFFPADGVGKLYYYEHAERNENLAGVSSIATFIKQKANTVDWSANDVAEHRPYIRKINGTTRLCWISTIVTKTNVGEGFVAGSSIEVFVTDSSTTKPVKVDASKPSLWVSQIEEELK